MADFSILFSKSNIALQTDGTLDTSKCTLKNEQTAKHEIVDLSSVKSSPDLVTCERGYTWKWLRLKDVPNLRECYALAVANYDGKTDYISHHQVAGRILDRRIPGLSGSEGSLNDHKATVIVLWQNKGEITDAFTLEPGKRAFNHAFGYIIQECYNTIINRCAESNIDPVKLGFNGPESLQLRFGLYPCENKESSHAPVQYNNEKMIKHFKVAANAPYFPQAIPV